MLHFLQYRATRSGPTSEGAGVFGRFCGACPEYAFSSWYRLLRPYDQLLVGRL